MKSHIGSNGPDRCRATTPAGCPFAPVEDHFSTKAEAEAEYVRRLESAYAQQGVTLQKQKELSEFDERLRERNAEYAQNIVALRAQLSGVTFEDADPQRAARRLKEAIEFARARNNSNLMTRLTEASVLPSGAFRLEDGTRFSTDTALKAYTANKFLEVEREAILSAIVASTKTHRPTTSNFVHTTPNGQYSLNFKRELDEGYFASLPAKVKSAILVKKSSISIDKARELLDEETFEKITNEQQKLDYVVGKVPQVGQSDIVVNRSLSGVTGDERVKSGVANLVGMYEQARVKYGSPAERKAELASYGRSMKTAALASGEGEVFIPARSQFNGAIVSKKRVLDYGKVKEVLNSQQIETLIVEKEEIDRARAREVLSDERYAALYGNVVAHFQVRQKPSV